MHTLTSAAKVAAARKRASWLKAAPWLVSPAVSMMVSGCPVRLTSRIWDFSDRTTTMLRADSICLACSLPPCSFGSCKHAAPIKKLLLQVKRWNWQLHRPLPASTLQHAVAGCCANVHHAHAHDCMPAADFMQRPLMLGTCAISILSLVKTHTEQCAAVKQIQPCTSESFCKS